jgi:hypothetical protein
MVVRTKTVIALVAGVVFVALSAWGLIAGPDLRTVFALLFLFTVAQTVAVVTAAGIFGSWTSHWALRGLRACVMIWCTISTLFILISTYSRYGNHGFLGWARDTDWELESTAKFGLTVGDLLLVAIFVLIQLLTLSVLASYNGACTFGSPNPRLKLPGLRVLFGNGRKTFQGSLRLYSGGKPGSLAVSRWAAQNTRWQRVPANFRKPRSTRR